MKLIGKGGRKKVKRWNEKSFNRQKGFVMKRKSPDFESKEPSLLTQGCENPTFTTFKLSPILKIVII